MAREDWVSDKADGASNDKKTVRFLNNSDNSNCDKIDNGPGQIPVTPTSNNPAINMVQHLVPHLPGLDKDKVYVISGPFPNFDPVSGPSQLLMATPVSSGATIIAVPTGPPPPASIQNSSNTSVSPNKPLNVPVSGAGQQQQQQQQVFHPPSPHMLHWDNHHPGGQILPLRQPNPPVYYNVPTDSVGSSNASSGLQSPASEGGSCMSESSSTSGDQEMEHQTQPVAPNSKQLYFQPGPGFHHPMPHMMGYPTHQLRHFQGPPQYCHMSGPVQGHIGHMGQMGLMQQHNGPGVMPHHFNQVYISQ